MNIQLFALYFRFNLIMRSLIWDLFTAKQEYKFEYKDNFDRIPYWSRKIQPMYDLSVADYLNKNGFKPYYPDGKKFALCISHDVDLLYLNDKKKIIRTLLSDLKKGKVQEIQQSIIRGVGKKIHPAYDIKKMIEIEQKYNANSSFYFLSLAENERDFNYKLSDIDFVFEEVKKSKNEIGLHGGHNAFNDFERLKLEKENLANYSGSEIKGYRGHYLKFNTPETWVNLERLGFEYDTTFGFAESIGFRNGTCYPFQPFDLNSNKFLDLVEIPLVIMDTSIYNYMKINPNFVFRFLVDFIDKIAQYNGVVTLLWHNTDSYDPSYEMFNKIVEYAYSRNAWMPTSTELNTYWKQENFLSIQNEILLNLKDK